MQSNLPAKCESKSLSIVQCCGSQTWVDEVKKVLTDKISPDAMLRVARSAAGDPKFAAADPKSFLVALLKCARVGLMPDGREAHLIPFGKEVQAIFDWKGLVALASRNGINVVPKLVHEADVFTVDEDDGSGQTKVTHRVDYRKDRGPIQAVYSRAVRADGSIDYEFMTAQEVEETRQQYSRAKDSVPWKASWGEMAKKTVIKRHSKRWDLAPEVRAAMNADDDTPAPLRQTTVTAPLFASPQIADASVNGAAEPAKPAPDGVVQQVRALCEKAGIRESELLFFVADIGSGPADAGSLEEVHLAQEKTLPMVVEQWPDISKRIIDNRNQK